MMPDAVAFDEGDSSTGRFKSLEDTIRRYAYGYAPGAAGTPDAVAGYVDLGLRRIGLPGTADDLNRLTGFRPGQSSFGVRLLPAEEQEAGPTPSEEDTTRGGEFDP